MGSGQGPQRDSRLGLFVEHAGDRDPVEALHLGEGRGQDLGGAHGGHVAAGLGQVAIEPQPVLQRREATTWSAGPGTADSPHIPPASDHCPPPPPPSPQSHASLPASTSCGLLSPRSQSKWPL